MIYVVKKGVTMSDDHKVNEIGRWYDTPIFISRMKEFMTKWMLTQIYDVDKSEYDEHIYFNYALNKHYINVKSKRNIDWIVDIAPNGREFLNKGE